MPTDNLTLRFKEALEKQGVVASNEEVTSFLQNKGYLNSSGAANPRSAVPVEEGGSQFTGGTLAPTLRTSTIVPPVSPVQHALDFAGSLAWHTLSSAAIGVPEIAMGEDAPYKWGDMSAGGNVGAVIGEAVGFFAPLGAIGAATKLGVRSVKGTGRMIGKATKAAGKAVQHGSGVDKEVAKGVVKKTLTHPLIKKYTLPHYTSSVEDFGKAEEVIKATLSQQLVKEFPTAGAKTIDDIIKAATDGLRRGDVHVNDISSWIAKSLNTTFSVADKSKITQYVGRATEMGVNFGIYNVMYNGIQSLAGKEEFKPLENVMHAFMFSSLLPAVEMVGGGGKIPIMRGAAKLKGLLKKYKPTNYDAMPDDAVKGLAKMMAKDSALFDTSIGRAIKDFRVNDKISAEKARELLNSLKAQISPEKAWADFRSAAGADFLKALPRMMLGGFYFNAQTLLDYNMLQNIDPEVLGAHILVGMFFTRMHKPLFKEKFPVITGMPMREKALEYFGMDAKQIEALASSDLGPNHIGNIYSGIMQDDIVKKIVNIIGSEENVQESKSAIGGVQDTGIGKHRYDLVRWAFDMYNRHELAKKARVEDSEIINVDLRNLSAESLSKIDKALRKIEFTTTGEKGEKTIEKLSTENFFEWRDALDESILGNTMGEYLKTLVSIANVLGIKHNVPIDMDWSKHDAGKPIMMGKIIGLETEGQGFVGDKGGMEYIYRWHQVRDILEEIGLVTTSKEHFQPVNVETIKKLSKKKLKNISNKAASKLALLEENLKRDNYGEESLVEINATDNGFLDAMKHWRHRKAMNESFNVIQGHRTNETTGPLREKLIEAFGHKVPQHLEGILGAVELVKPKEMNEKEWADISKDMGEDGAIQIVAKLGFLAKIWGHNKSDGKLKNDGKIDFYQARALVDAFEQEGWRLTDSFAEQSGKYYWNRFLETAHVTTSTKAVLDSFRLHGIAKFIKQENRSILEFPDLATARAVFEKAEKDGEMTPAETASLLEKYESLIHDLGTITSKFVEFKKRAFLRHHPAGDLAGAIRESYNFTRNFHRDVVDHYKNLEDLGADHSNWLGGVRSILDSLFIEDKKNPTQLLLKIDDLSMNSPKSREFLTDINKAISILIKEGEKLDFVEPKSLLLLKSLREKLIQEKLDVDDVTTPASAIRNMLEMEGRKVSTLQALVNEIVFDMNNFSSDRILGKRRLDTSISDLMKVLEGEGVDLTDLGENPNLSAVASKFLKSRKGLDGFIDRMSIRLRAWRKSYSEEDFIKEQDRLREEYKDLSSANTGSTRWSSEHIRTEYSKYNDMFETESWDALQKELFEAREIELDKGSSAKDRAIANQRKKDITDKIIEGVKEAIKEKQYVKNGIKVEQSKIDAEFSEFMQTVFPHFLARNIGTEKIKTATLDFDKNGNPMMLFEEAAHGKGALTMFMNDMSEAGVTVAKLNHTGIYNNRKVDVNKIQDKEGQSPLDNINARANTGEKIALLEENQEPGQDPIYKTVRVITSYNSTLMVRTDNLIETKEFLEAEGGVKADGQTRGILNHKFNIWYRNKERSLVEKGFHGLVPDPGGRKKGQKYRKKINGRWTDVYDVLVDMYEHPYLKNPQRDPRDIWIADSLQEAENQLAAIKAGLGGGTRFDPNNLGFQKVASRNGSYYLLEHGRGDNKYVYVRNESDSAPRFLKAMKGIATEAEAKRAKSVLKNLEILYKDFINGKGATDEEARQMIRAMYWDNISSRGFEDMINLIADKDGLAEHGAGMFKYFSLAEASGAKLQGNHGFLKEMRSVDKKHNFLTDGQRKAIDYYDGKKGLDIISIRDESVDGTNINAFSNESLVKAELKRKLDRGEFGEKGGDSYIKASEQMAELVSQLGSLGAGSSSINAHTWIGTNTAHLTYMHRGRMLRDGDHPGFGIPNTAGVKPSVWFNSPESTVLMKTNFAFDPKVAKLLDNLGIDMITTESAAKMFNAKQIEMNKQSFNDFIKSRKGTDKENKAPSFDEMMEHIIPTRADMELVDPITNQSNISRIQLENLFIGKTEDRKGITNITYAFSDFMSQPGADSFMKEYVDYGKKMQRSLRLVNDLSSSSRNRTAIAEFMLRSLREEGALTDGTSSSLTNHLFQNGVDPSSVLVRDNIRRIAHKWFINELRNPKTKGASYSILMPFIEGSLPVYGKMDGVKTQIIYGGKKLAHDDGNIKITNWDRVKYIASIESVIDGKKVRRDVQVGKSEGKWVIFDPYEKQQGGVTDAGNIKAYNLAKKTITDRIDRAQEFSRTKTPGNLKDIHDRLMYSNKRQSKDNENNTIHLHSLSLRMPNIGSDVSAHKVEGFYDHIQSNVVGVNLIDLASIHQADFDVDALFSYHDATFDITKSIFDQAGLAPDAYTYTKNAKFDIDIFNNGYSASKAGSGGKVNDSLQEHIENYSTSKDNFGRAKRLGTGISALQKLKFGLNLEGEKGREFFNILGLEGVDGDKGITKKHWGGFLQRYKNTMQTLIDATKRPNFLSNAKFDDLARFVLFGEQGGLREEAVKNVKDNLGDYGEENYRPLFDFSGEKDVHRRKVYQDIVLETINLLGRSTRILGDVFDETGRRPPEAVEMYQFKNALYGLTGGNMNKAMFNILLGKYSNNEAGRNALMDIFFKLGGYEDRKALRKDLKSKFFKQKDPDVNVININPSLGELKNSSIGNFIALEYNDSITKSLGYSQSLNRSKKIDMEVYGKLMSDIDAASSLLGSKEAQEGVWDFIENEKMSPEFGNRIRDFAKMYTEKKDGTFTLGKGETPSSIQDYSTLYHILEKQRNSMQRFVNKGGRMSTTSQMLATRRITSLNTVLQYIRKKETDMIDGFVSKQKDVLAGTAKADNLMHHFYYRDHNLTKSKKGKTPITNPTDQMQFVYKVIVGDKGVRRYKKIGYVKPNGVYLAQNGSEYVVLKNPVRYEPMDKVDVLDSYAMMHVTGNVRADHVVGIDNADAFTHSADMLRRDLGALTRETYNLSKKSPSASENWMWESKVEDKLVKEFFDKWGNNVNRDIESQGGFLSPDIENKKTFALAAYLMKPSVAFGDVVFARNTGITLPSFKMNKRLTNAVFRYLRENNPEIGREISNEYGRNFRMRYENIIPSETSDMLNSFLYTTPPKGERSAILDLVFDRGMDLYEPAIFHLVRGELAQYKNRSLQRYDENGELQLMDRYGRYDDIQSIIGLYKDQKQFVLENDRNRTWDCY